MDRRLALFPFLLAPVMAEAGTLHRGEYPTTLPEGPLSDEPVTEESKAILAEVSACVANPEGQTGVSVTFRTADKLVRTEIAVGDVNVDQSTWDCAMAVAQKHEFFDERDDRMMTHPLGDQSVHFLRLSESLGDEAFASVKDADDARKALAFKMVDTDHSFSPADHLPGMAFGGEYMIQPKRPTAENWGGPWPAGTSEQIGFVAQQTKKDPRDIGRARGVWDDIVTDELRVPFSPDRMVEAGRALIVEGEGSFNDGTRVEFQTIECQGGDQLSIAVVTPSPSFVLDRHHEVNVGGSGYFSGVQGWIFNHIGHHLPSRLTAELFCAAEGDEKEEAAKENERYEKLRAQEAAATPQ